MVIVQETMENVQENQVALLPNHLDARTTYVLKISICVKDLLEPTLLN